MLDRALVFIARLIRAWRYHRLLRYSWRLAWAKAGWQVADL
jgi:hypothetical protein